MSPRPTYLLEVESVRHSGRWTASRKRACLNAIDAHEITPAQACERYGLSLEELDIWRLAHAIHGSRGLMVSHLAETRS